MTDFRARGTIMGPTGLTAVFGMGTGVTPPVWSPERRPAGGQAAPGVGQSGVRSRRRDTAAVGWRRPSLPTGPLPAAGSLARGVGRGIGRFSWAPRSVAAAGGRGGRIGVVKRSAVGTGPLRRSPAVHSQPIDLVVFQEPS